MISSAQGTLGPLTQAIFNKIWEDLLFVKGSKLYLPNIIKNGDPSSGIIPYDPYVVSGQSDLLEVEIPQQTRDTACLSLQFPNIPVGIGNPTLIFSNLLVRNLRAVQRDGNLSFPPGYKVSANVKFGQLDNQLLPLTIETNDKSKPSYLFTQHCCVPKSPPQPGQQPDCEQTFSNVGTGNFIAKLSTLQGYIEVTIDTSSLNVATVDLFQISFNPDAVSFDFNVDQSGGDLGKEAMEAMVQASIQTGIANNEVQRAINSLAETDNFKDDLKTLINEAIKEIFLVSKVTIPASAKD